MDPVRILSIDGGGIRGLIPAKILYELERRTEKPISSLFDLIAGTSTGGIIAVALSCPGEGGPRFSAQALVEFYLTEGPRIFKRSPWRIGLLEEKYPSQTIEGILQEYLGDITLSEALVEILVTAYEIELRQPYFFKRHRAREGEQPDIALWQVARATSAAPTYFEPARVEVPPSFVRQLDPRAPKGKNFLSLVDGGVMANNPAMCALAEARRLWPGRPVILVSLGTGELTRPIPHEEAIGWGLAGWARPLLDVIFDGVSDTADYQCRWLLEEGGNRYFRFQTTLTLGKDDLDDASQTNLHALETLAEELISREASRLEQLLENLVR